MRSIHCTKMAIVCGNHRAGQMKFECLQIHDLFLNAVFSYESIDIYCAFLTDTMYSIHGLIKNKKTRLEKALNEMCNILLITSVSDIFGNNKRQNSPDETACANVMFRKIRDNEVTRQSVETDEFCY